MIVLKAGALVRRLFEDFMSNDTVKIERPMSCRRHEDFGGRVKQDPLGNTVKVKTRVHDPQDDSAVDDAERFTTLGPARDT
jgi:hypothetical protein